MIVIFISGGCATSKKAKRLKELKAHDENIQKLNEALDEMYNAINLEATMKAAERGEAHCQWLIAKFYREDIRLPKNERLAFSWDLKAANLGWVPSQITISDCYAQGIGVIQDDIKAYAWANIANSVKHQHYSEMQKYAKRIDDSKKELKLNLPSETLTFADSFKVETIKKMNETKNKLSKDQIAISQALAIKLYEEIYGEEQENPVNKVIH